MLRAAESRTTRACSRGCPRATSIAVRSSVVTGRPPTTVVSARSTATRWNRTSPTVRGRTDGWARCTCRSAPAGSHCPSTRDEAVWDRTVPSGAAARAWWHRARNRSRSSPSGGSASHPRATRTSRPCETAQANLPRGPAQRVHLGGAPRARAESGTDGFESSERGGVSSHLGRLPEPAGAARAPSTGHEMREKLRKRSRSLSLDDTWRSNVVRASRRGRSAAAGAWCPRRRSRSSPRTSRRCRTSRPPCRGRTCRG